MKLKVFPARQTGLCGATPQQGTTFNINNQAA